MTNQEIFDTVYRHLLSQGKRAKTEDGDCVYRTEDGAKCAVGCLIPDELYMSDIETASAELAALGVRDGARERFLGEIFDEIGIPKESAYLLGALQGVHDHEHPDEWQQALEFVAEKYGLTVPQ